MKLPRRDIAHALWTTLVHCYHQGGRTKVELPYEEALTILCALQANILSSVPNRNERRRLQRMIGPGVDRMLKAAEEKPHNHIASKGNGLILPG